MEKEMIYKKALSKYGIELQMLVCIEECSELIKALTKYRRIGIDQEYEECGNIVKNIAEEIADVKIMIEQVTMALDIYSEVNLQQMFKLERLEHRLYE